LKDLSKGMDRLQNQEIKKMKCVFCGGTTVKKMVTFFYENHDRFLIVEDTPAEVCTKCGEKTYSLEVTDELLRFAKDESLPTKTIEVPVFSFTEA
jgi:HTH-type transcriptional regulator / antitoxin MqsA